jgi:hypothetical protein
MGIHARETAMRIARSLILSFALLAVPAMPAVAQHEHEHSHGHDPAGGSGLVAQLQLDQGQRWATDETLRTGMAAIRKAFDEDHPRIHAGKQTDAQYDALAASLEREVNQIVARCKLPPAADAQLHLVVGDLLQGVALMRGSDPARSRHDGAALVHGALRAYPKFFDDPGFAAD